MTDTRPIARCQEKGCPCIGRFATGYCPMHIRDAPRPPTLYEKWTADPGSQP